MKRIISILLAVAFAAALFVGCGAKTNTPTDVVVAKVNGEEIMRSDYRVLFNAYYDMYVARNFDMTADESLTTLQGQILSDLISSLIMDQQIAAHNITLTAQEETAVQEAIEANRRSVLGIYEARAAEEDAQDVSSRALELLAEQASLDGYVSLDAYWVHLEKQHRTTALADKLRQTIVGNVTLTDAQAEERFYYELGSQVSAYSSTPSDYQTDLETYENMGGIPPLYVPEGFIRVKHILVEDEALAGDIYARLQSGEDFDTLLLKHSTDTASQSDPYLTSGYLLCATTSSFVPEFVTASFSIENVGDIAAPVKSSYGYHIVKLIEKVESTMMTWEEYKENYGKDALLEQYRQQVWQNQLEVWGAQSEVVSYISRVRDIGRTKNWTDK
ncbi:MAG: peptidylprolyl isomerase [Clostridiales bacterium]|jgi:parvulin-like peptidyl-prolyl isomerase|nr:peptidylprolyl isomerase [Clostridiales bacterium]